MNKSRVLLIAEHDNQVMHSATLNTMTAASACGDNISILVAGQACENIAQQAAEIEGVSEVLCVDDQVYGHHLAENCAALIAKIGKDYDYILAPATTFGKNSLPRAAALLNVGQISDVIDILSADTFSRPTYAGNALVTVQSLEPIKVMTVRPTAFKAAQVGQKSVTIKYLKECHDVKLSQFIALNKTVSERPDLSQAKIVVSGGRGLQSAENFALLEQLADRLSAAIGASRAAVDAEFVPNDYQVGQTGKVVAPELYIAIGISGAIQHLAGMKDSKIIVAINKDPEAPIFQIATYGLVGDLFKIVPELIAELGAKE